jgi:hypothetical protein
MVAAGFYPEAVDMNLKKYSNIAISSPVCASKV